MVKRPVLVAVIGYIIGILMGLYFKFSIVLFYLPITVIYYIFFRTKVERKKEFKLISFYRYFRYIKLLLKKFVILIFLISAFISNSIVLIQNKRYNNLYKDGENLNLIGVIVSDKEEKEYYDIYNVKINNNTHLYLNMGKQWNKSFNYGDKVSFQGTFIEPASQRNSSGFDYKEYLKTKKIFGSVKVEKITLLDNNKANILLLLSNKIKIKLEQNINKLFSQEEASILNGILLGDTSNIEQNIYENFQVSSIAHVLAVSGMHVSYIIIGVNLLFRNILGNRRTKFLVIIMLILYMFLSDFSPSIVRASLMNILIILSSLLYRKNDIWTSLSFSLFIILINNPFMITNIGLQFSYIGTIGIILFQSTILEILNTKTDKYLKNKHRIKNVLEIPIKKTNEILSVMFSAQIVLVPIILFNFNFIGIYFIITNLIVSIIICPIFLLGLLFAIISLIFLSITKKISFILEILVKILIQVSNISKLPFSKIYIPTPKIWMIILYYLLIILFKIIYDVYHKKRIITTEYRVRNLIELSKYNFRKNKKKIYYLLFMALIIFILILYIYPKNLKIYFVDVNQGDCTFIVTPKNKTILIDGGGSLSDSFDIGKRILVPYILDRGYKKIDYIVISHYDQDHVRTDF